MIISATDIENLDTSATDIENLDTWGWLSEMKKDPRFKNKALDPKHSTM